MAEKRMFAKEVVLSDLFLDMPNSARCLYFLLGLQADDDGFVNSPKSIMRQSGATEDDIKILVSKKFLIAFISGVVLITHWKINNNLRSDRYKITNCPEIKLVGVNERNEYYLLSDGGKYNRKLINESKEDLEIENIDIDYEVKQEITENTINTEVAEIERVYKENYKRLYDLKIVKLEQPIVKWNVCKKLAKEAVEKYGFDNVMLALNKSLDDKFCINCGYSLNIILSVGVLSNLLNRSDCEKNELNFSSQIDKINKKEIFNKLLIQTHPTKCKYCGDVLVGDDTKFYWYCMKCRKEWKFNSSSWEEHG